MTHNPPDDAKVEPPEPMHDDAMPPPDPVAVITGSDQPADTTAVMAAVSAPTNDTASDWTADDDRSIDDRSVETAPANQSEPDDQLGVIDHLMEPATAGSPPSPATEAVPGSPYEYPPLGSPRSRSMLPVVIGVGAGLLAVACVASLAGLAVWARNSSSQSSSTTQTTGKIGQTLIDGSVSFVVTKVNCGIREVGGTLGTRTPAGQFCVVELSVANHGSQKMSTVGPFQVAFDRKGGRYPIDGPATAYMNRDRRVALDLAPGATGSAALVFDVPTDAKLTRLELHATDHSRGVIVRL